MSSSSRGAPGGERSGCLAALVGFGALFGGILWFLRREPGPRGVNRVSLEAGHETTDVDYGHMLTVIVLLLVGIGIVVIMSTAFETLLTGRLGLFPLQTTIAVLPTVQPPPEPRLESDNGQVLNRLQAAEDKLLNDYTWIDQSAGTVRIPIDRAIDLTVQRGLPVRQNTVSSPGVGQGGALTRPSSSSSGRALEAVQP